MSAVASREARFPELLVRWALKGNLRSFPWRLESDPYRLLIAELMLRRTRGQNVVETFHRFIERWPMLEAFVSAEDEELFEVLHPLGLRWRAANFIQLRDRLQRSGGLELREGYEAMLTLPGVGDYVASAVCCFSRCEVRPLIDTNSVRVIGRVFGMTVGPETRRRRTFRLLAERLVPADQPRLYNYALLDLAASVCTIRNPACKQCPLEGICDFAASLRAGRQ